MTCRPVSQRCQVDATEPRRTGNGGAEGVGVAEPQDRSATGSGTDGPAPGGAVPANTGPADTGPAGHGTVTAGPAAGGTFLAPREVMIVLPGLLMAILLAMLDNLIVSTALPRIVGDLGG